MAIIGGGIGGATAGCALSQAGLEVSVRDDGRGGAIVIPEADSGHVGLRILHDVMADLGGRLTLGAAPEGGTELQASLPHQRDRDDDVETLVST